MSSCSSVFRLFLITFLFLLRVNATAIPNPLPYPAGLEAELLGDKEETSCHSTLSNGKSYDGKLMCCREFAFGFVSHMHVKSKADVGEGKDCQDIPSEITSDPKNGATLMRGKGLCKGYKDGGFKNGWKDVPVGCCKISKDNGKLMCRQIEGKKGQIKVNYIKPGERGVAKYDLY